MNNDILIAAPLRLALSWDRDALVEITLRWSGPGEPESTDVPPRARPFLAALKSLVRGEATEWPLPPLDMDTLTPFSRQVLETLRREVGQGRVTTYGRLAALAGRPLAARAVGRVMASNRWPLVFPCHRVLGSGGKLTGFSGAGLEMKEYLLKQEKALPANWKG